MACYVLFCLQYFWITRYCTHPRRAEVNPAMLTVGDLDFSISVGGGGTSCHGLVLVLQPSKRVSIDVGLLEVLRVCVLPPVSLNWFLLILYFTSNAYGNK